jgi:NDP-sugar pyrophosphorylase family protein
MIGKKSLIEVAIEKLRSSGFKTIYIIARQKILTSAFNILKDGSMYGVKINYIEEITSKGSAETLRLLKGKVDSNFLVVYGDIYFDKINLEDIWNDHFKTECCGHHHYDHFIYAF